MIQRGGQVVMRMLASVQQKMIQPIIEAAVTKGARIHTDEVTAQVGDGERRPGQLRAKHDR